MEMTCIAACHASNARFLPNAKFMLGERRTRWISINPALGKRYVLTCGPFKLYKKLNHLQDPKIHFQCELFDKIIIPICDYGCEVWGFHKAPAIERVIFNFASVFYMSRNL